MREEKGERENESDCTWCSRMLFLAASRFSASSENESFITMAGGLDMAVNRGDPLSCDKRVSKTKK